MKKFKRSRIGRYDVVWSWHHILNKTLNEAWAEYLRRNGSKNIQYDGIYIRPSLRFTDTMSVTPNG